MSRNLIFFVRMLVGLIVAPAAPGFISLIVDLCFTHNSTIDYDLGGLKLFAVLGYFVELLIIVPMLILIMRFRIVKLRQFLMLGAAAGVVLILFIASATNPGRQFYNRFDLFDLKIFTALIAGLVFPSLIGSLESAIVWVIARPDLYYPQSAHPSKTK